MNIIIANKLLELRKKTGFSQEELAEKLGISRQAVSKWERAEAAPDTDNLIALAKLYNVSLDELLLNDGYSDESKEAIKTDSQNVNNNYNAQNRDAWEKTAEECDRNSDEWDKNAEAHYNKNDRDYVEFSDGGVHVLDKDGTEVHVGIKGIYVDDKKSGEKVNIGFGHRYKGHYKHIEKEQRSKLYNFFIKFPFPIITVIAFLLWGFFIPGGWTLAWLSFLAIPLYYTLIDAIEKRNAHHFAYPVLATGVFLFVGLAYGIWHPTWVIFLSIPIYYCIVSAIRGEWDNN